MPVEKLLLDPRIVLIEGQPCKVLVNIYPILELMCDHGALGGHAYFWIDYLCINQGDELERGQQVALMGQLYCRAYHTVVWLGPSTPDTRGATTAMHLIAAWRHGAAPHEQAAARDAITSDQWRALSRWMLRPWWTRVWTLQEFLLPERLVFHCGPESVTKATWSQAVGMLYDYSAVGMLEHKAFGNQWARRRLLNHYDNKVSGEKMGLVAMMAYVGYYQATDQRDRIYALLGVCSDRDRDVVGQADYHASVEEVYTRLAVRFIHVHRSLDIICFAALFNKVLDADDDEGGDEEPLPSWIPDWRRFAYRASRPVPSMVSEPSRQHIGNFRPTGFQPNPDLIYMASANLPAQYLISEDQRRLTCQGLIIDTIDGLGPAHHPAPDDNADPSLHLVQSTSRINLQEAKTHLALDRVLSQASSDSVLEALIRSLSLNRSGRYLTSAAQIPSYMHEFQHTLVNVMGARPLPTECAPVIEWFLANQALRIRGATLRYHCEAATPPPAAKTRTAGRKKHTIWRAAETTVGEWPWDCRLVVTAGGDLGMVPRLARKDDVVCVLIGCSVPVVLRRSDYDDALFTLIGECFFPGIMEGEALDEGRAIRDFVLV
ncbi:hypothetical protein M406DRAFT_335698 [Cryphonectria parasitica EP155]|uniref:Heterokaryon incompatibility domain-containing protein n=1 Tax=Cryphonectria parasitica (strain ATCC 38755 / EP155) TaxID=660469 RepID=A0A9P4YBF8_CRYP1|nr:uncharacterized protein M406DRAFT_335698 [Cryphonectria parasitica EP155]KAF3769919.1 hypothetical protein M406DRAFT_335698 [Cryphonectria parasitica EP155]